MRFSIVSLLALQPFHLQAETDCQCSDLTTKHLGNVIGNCLTEFHNVSWCYISSISCEDKREVVGSAGLFYSYQACLNRGKDDYDYDDYYWSDDACAGCENSEYSSPVTKVSYYQNFLSIIRINSAKKKCPSTHCRNLFNPSICCKLDFDPISGGF